MILMIDEETKRMKVMKEYLEESGYDILYFDNVDSSYDFIEKNIKLIDLIILDIMMPWGKLFGAGETEKGLLSGYQFYHKFRHEFGFSIPIIVYTAINRDEIINNLSNQENTIVFRKPTRPSLIVSAIKKFFDDRRK